MLTKSHAFTMFAAIGMSFILIHSTILKNSGLSSLEQVFFRITLSLPLMLIVFRDKTIISVKKSDVPFFASIGLVFTLFLLSALSSLVFGAPITVAVALIYTQPIFTALISRIVGGEKIRPVKGLLILAGTAGAFLATGLSLSDITGMKVNTGILFALCSGIFYALYLFLKRRGKIVGHSPGKILFNTFLFAIPWIAVLGVVLRIFTTAPLFVGFVVPDYGQLLLLLSFAVFSTILPYGSLNCVDPKEISPTTEGVTLLLDPVLHTLWAILIFQQFVSPLQYVGVFLVILTAGINLKLVQS